MLRRIALTLAGLFAIGMAFASQPAAAGHWRHGWHGGGWHHPGWRHHGWHRRYWGPVYGFPGRGYRCFLPERELCGPGYGWAKPHRYGFPGRGRHHW